MKTYKGVDFEITKVNQSEWSEKLKDQKPMMCKIMPENICRETNCFTKPTAPASLVENIIRDIKCVLDACDWHDDISPRIEEILSHYAKEIKL